MGSNINRKGITNEGFISAPKMQDKSDSHDVKVTSGATIKKQQPGNNTSIVDLIPDHRR